MVTVKVGDKLCSEWGEGPIVAITEEYVILRVEEEGLWNGCEAVINLEDDHYWLPIECFEQGGGKQEAEVK